MTCSCEEARARTVAVSETTLTVDLVDGRTIVVPVEWYPRLDYATPEERGHWRIFGDGLFINFPDLDEDLRVGGLLEGKRSLEGPETFNMWLEAKKAGRPLDITSYLNMSGSSGKRRDPRPSLAPLHSIGGPVLLREESADFRVGAPRFEGLTGCRKRDGSHLTGSQVHRSCWA